MASCYLLALLQTSINQHRPKTPLFSDDEGCFVMLEGFEMVDVLEAPIVPKDFVPRNNIDVDGCGDCFSPIEYSPVCRCWVYWLFSKSRKAKEPPYSLMLDK